MKRQMFVSDVRVESEYLYVARILLHRKSFERSGKIAASGRAITIAVTIQTLLSRRG